LRPVNCEDIYQRLGFEFPELGHDLRLPAARMRLSAHNARAI
jgi:hypothetical protein